MVTVTKSLANCDNFVRFLDGSTGVSFHKTSMDSFSRVAVAVVSNFIFFHCLLTTALGVGLYNISNGLSLQFSKQF